MPRILPKEGDGRQISPGSVKLALKGQEAEKFIENEHPSNLSASTFRRNIIASLT